jgi:hypothetical protein
MSNQPILVWLGAVAIFAGSIHEAQAFGRRGGRCCCSCEPCCSVCKPSQPGQHLDPATNGRLPRDARLWLEIGKWTKEKGSDDSKVVLRGDKESSFEVSKSDLVESDGKMLLRNGAKIFRLRELNPNRKHFDDCMSGYYPNSRYLKDTDCYVLVLFCNYCNYDSSGRYTHTTSEACGVCAGL